MKKIYLCARHFVFVALPLFILAGLLPFAASAQTNPVAQPLPYSQDFSAFNGTVTTYPIGLQGWTITGSTAATFPLVAAASDQALVAGVNSLTSAFVGDMNGKIGFLCTGANIKTIVLSVNTSSNTAIAVSYIAATQRQESGARIGAIGLQYRVGVSGTFTNVTGSEYQNPGGTTNTSGTTSLNPQTITVSLPAACENQAIVQLRWVYREVSGSGNRPGFSIDELKVSGTTGGGSTPAISVNPASLSGFSTTAGTASAQQSVTVSGTNLGADVTLTPTAPYEISIDGGSNYSALPATITQTGGVINNTTVYIRIAASAAAGTANGSVDFTSAGATSQTVTLTGNVISNVVVDPPLTFNASPVSTSEIDLSGTGNAANDNLLVATNASATFGTPAGALVVGNAIGGGGTVIYNGPSAGFSFQHTGLAPGTAYFYKAWSVDGSNNYSTTGLAANASTNNPPKANVVINQVYGGGGNTGAYYKNDFIELYNNENTPVNLSGWSVQYSSAAGKGNWLLHTLSGIIPPHSFFLIQEAAGSAGVSLPAPDASGTLALSATAGKVLLSNSTTVQSGDNPSDINLIIDKVGYGATATGFETSPAPGTDNTTAVVRVTVGADNNNNSTDFVVGSPIPRNSTYTITAPVILSLTPPNGRTDVPYNIQPAITFDKPVVKGTGTITLYENGVAGTPIDVNNPAVIITGNKHVSIPVSLSPAKSYYILVSAGAFTDVYGNAFAGISGTSTWAFATYNSGVSTIIPVTFNFQQCNGNGLLPDGFTQYNEAGGATWDCTPYGFDPANPASADSFPNAIQMNGYDNLLGNVTNKDWLISPALDLTGSTYPLLSFQSRTRFIGDPLQLKVSTDYTGTGDPNLATWTDLNGKFPQSNTNVWVPSSNINLFDFKSSNVHIAFVYTSTTEDGARWIVDDVSVINSPTPPPPSLSVNPNSLQFNYVAGGSSSTKTFTVLGNDLSGGGGINITATGAFQVSDGSSGFANSLNLSEATANNVSKTITVQFSPADANRNYTGSITISTAGTVDTSVSLSGTSIDPARTLELVNWNMEWFHSPDPTLGPTNKAQQLQNARTILPALDADLYALVEVVDTAALGDIVRNNMPGYSYVICNYGSHGNVHEAGASPINTLQKEAFVYKTSMFSSIDTTSLLSNGVGTAADLSNPDYNYWSSGRYPFMMTADVTLGSDVKRIHFIAIHAKANSGSNDADLITSYNRRMAGATSLHNYLNTTFPNDNIVILGDYNDDLDSTITTQIGTPHITSYKTFTDDVTSFYSPTLHELSLKGKVSTTGFNDVIDHVMVSNELQPNYMVGSTTVRSDVAALVSNYATSTSDHYPVFTRYAFDQALLPVKLESFAAVKDGSAVKVSWKSAEEINSSEYIVQRSADGISFTNIGTVTAKGFSSDYLFTDANPLTGSNFYRLKPVDKDGKFVYSKVVKINFTKLPGIHISPNPASSYIYLSLENINSTVNLQLIDVNGKLVKQQLITKGTVNKTISLSGVAKGLYTIKMVSQEQVATQKLVVQ